MKVSSLLIILVLFCASCAVRPVAPEVLQEKLHKGFIKKNYNTKNFRILTLQRITDDANPIRIYIEGDGFAYSSRTQPSSNPTPKNPLVLSLIDEDDSPNLIYMARPCQYLSDTKCEQKYWTTARFSKEAIDSADEVIKKFSNRKIELVGYSGGAEIAIFVAAQNPNVISMRTVAGNLDHKAFTDYHKVTPLKDSENPYKSIKDISNLPQIHFIGGSDKIISENIAKEYMDDQIPNSCTKLVRVEGATHGEGWAENWKSLLKQKPECRSIVE